MERPRNHHQPWQGPSAARQVDPVLYAVADLLPVVAIGTDFVIIGAFNALYCTSSCCRLASRTCVGMIYGSPKTLNGNGMGFNT